MSSNGSETRYRPTTLPAVLEHWERGPTYLAKRARVSPQHLSNMLAGRYPFSAEYAERIAEALNLPVSVLFAPIESDTAAD